MDESTDQKNPLTIASQLHAEVSLQNTLRELRESWIEKGVAPWPVPLVSVDQSQPRRDWLSENDWISGWEAFDIFKLQAIEDARSIARICQTICDQVDRDEHGLNYAMDGLPPNHTLIADFALGSNQWFRALWSMLSQYGAKGIEGWEAFVSDLQDWLTFGDHLRIRAFDVARSAVSTDWQYHDISLPEAKQNAVWSFPHAMAWIATRDYLALARLGVFYRSENDDELAIDGVCIHNSRALGWLQTAVAFAKCDCGAFDTHRWQATKHCTCLSVAWEDLVKFSGGLTDQTPELVFSISEGWISMIWPEGADKLRFLRRDILDQWPASPPPSIEAPACEHSTALGEQECRDWLIKEFASDPDKRSSKKDFRDAALTAFAGRLSERGFNLRVWPDLARENGRDGAGAKRKS